jgi:eukaryotic-like serine/threonine-protein kinase
VAESGSGGRSLDALLGEIARSPDVVPATSLVGKTVGRYRVDALLGRGGMGVVYRAFDEKLARDVALKVLPPELLGDAERRARFLREARLAAAVTHPCTAAVYDVGEEGDAVFLAMELIRGKTLRAALGGGALDVARAVRITRDIARGLSKAHESGIVHRDLKPENVMLDDEDQVRGRRGGRPEHVDRGGAHPRDPELHVAGAGEGQEGRCA